MSTLSDNPFVLVPGPFWLNVNRGQTPQTTYGPTTADVGYRIGNHNNAFGLNLRSKLITTDAYGLYYNILVPVSTHLHSFKYSMNFHSQILQLFSRNFIFSNIVPTDNILSVSDAFRFQTRRCAGRNTCKSQNPKFFKKKCIGENEGKQIIYFVIIACVVRDTVEIRILVHVINICYRKKL